MVVPVIVMRILINARPVKFAVLIVPVSRKWLRLLLRIRRGFPGLLARLMLTALPRIQIILTKVVEIVAIVVLVPEVLVLVGDQMSVVDWY